MVTVFIFLFQAPHDESEDGTEDEGDIAEDIIDNNDSIDDANGDDAGDGHIAEVCDIAVEVKLS